MSEQDRTEDAVPGEDARGGEIILRKPLMRFIFAAGLSGIVIFVLLLMIF